jgi:bicarbonate transport system permease protein
MMNSLSLFPSLLDTLWALALGVVPASVVGIVVGLLLGQVKVICEVAKRVLQVPASLPGVLLLPILLAVTQTNSGLMRSWIAAFVTLWWVMIYSAIAAQVARQKGHWRFAIPQITLGLRFGLMLAWSAVIVAEMVMAGATGVGFYLWDQYQQAAELKYLVDGAVAIALTAFLLDQLIDLIGIGLLHLLKPTEPNPDS